jgi:hypothetical protein
MGTHRYGLHRYREHLRPILDLDFIKATADVQKAITLRGMAAAGLATAASRL